MNWVILILQVMIGVGLSTLSTSWLLDRWIMNILMAEQMRRIDELTVERCTIPYSTLMETAGSRVIEAMFSYLPERKYERFILFCGKGNNGGDGAVVARQLWLRKSGRVDVWLAGSIQEMSGPARTNMEIISRVAGLDGSLRFSELRDSGHASGLFGDSLEGVVVVDALLGTGITRPAEGIIADAIETIKSMRKRGATVVSVDLPSGVPSDQGQFIGLHVEADLTVTFTAPKVGNLVTPAADANGRLVIASIGTPECLIQEELTLSESGGRIELVEDCMVGEWLESSRRGSMAHKGVAGSVLIFAGSPGRTGAAALAAGAVLRTGAGLVTVATPATALPLLVAQADSEVMTEPLVENASGSVGIDSFEKIVTLAATRDILAIGPGLSSVDGSARELVQRLAEVCKLPIVIDADGLNALAPWPVGLKGSVDKPIVITPHPGEMARLMGMKTFEIEADRVAVARELAQRQHLIVVLKGSRTLIAEPEGRVFVNPTGNAGMATAGAGDVLTGMIAGFLAQRSIPVLDAVIAGVYLHGLAGDLAAAALGQRSMMASNIRDLIGDAIGMVGGEAERIRRGPSVNVAGLSVV